ETEALGIDPNRPALRWFFEAASSRQVKGLAAKNGVPDAGLAGGGMDRGERGAGKRAERGVAGVRAMEAGPGARDLGGSDWEQRLVTVLRLRGMAWRTEDTYRQWARRFAEGLAP